MKLTRNRTAATAAAAILSLAGLTFAFAPAASAASGGGCSEKGSAGPAETVYSCISSPAYAEVVGDAYVYMSSVPAGCTTIVEVYDVDSGKLVASRTVPCATSQHVIAPTAIGESVYRTLVIVDGNVGPWSPFETLP